MELLPFRPGLVGGHCIEKLTHTILLSVHRDMDTTRRLSLLGVMNDSMGEYVADETIKHMLKKGIQVYNSDIIILGFTFKENCPDVVIQRLLISIKH